MRISIPSYKIVYFSILSVWLFSCKEPNPNDTVDFSQRFEPVAEENIFEDSAYFNWGSSIVKGDDSLYHLFYSRFPKKFGFQSWRTHSEIAHAVAENPAGPYKFREVVLSRRNANDWDATSVHNPHIQKFGGKYYLYHIGTNMDGEAFNEKWLLEVINSDPIKPQIYQLRDNQRIGVAIADSINGKWQRFDEPILQPNRQIARYTTNPSVTKTTNGEFLMMLKGTVHPEDGKKRMLTGVAFSKSPDKGFEIKAKIDDYAGFEDAFLWHDQASQRFYALIHNEGKNQTELITSENALDWTAANHQFVFGSSLSFANGTQKEFSTIERPYIYFENGKPSVLSMAVLDNENKTSFCVFLKLKP